MVIPRSTSPTVARGLETLQDLKLGEELVLDAIRRIPLQRGFLALTGCPLALAGCLCSLLIQLLLETCEHLEELVLRGKLSPESVDPCRW